VLGKFKEITGCKVTTLMDDFVVRAGDTIQLKIYRRGTYNDITPLNVVCPLPLSGTRVP